MRILLCHNHYQQPGGEDQVFAAEAQLLEDYGHHIVRFTRHNRTVEQLGWWQTAVKCVWNQAVYRELRELIRRERPDVMHCTNIFPLISPAAYWAARHERIPVVQSLHNYRLLCPNAQLLRDGRVCEQCAGRRVAWPSVTHACYRDSRAGSAVVTAMLAFHRKLRTWTRAVDRFIALTEFSRGKLIAGGLPAEKIVVKPNFVARDPGPGRGRGGYAVFIGRLAPEKGLAVLLDAWSRMPQPISLKIVGDGPMANTVRDAAERDPAIEWLGRRSHDEVMAVLGDAAVLVMPSLGYETFGLVIAEAFSRGTPVIASRLGAVGELVDHGRTGLLFTAGDAGDLAAAVGQFWDEPQCATHMRQPARAEFEAKYTRERNYEQLMSIYEDVVGARHVLVPHLARPTSKGWKGKASGSTHNPS
jgi:glycosyltransferase involved in cell wall biosynthesis